MESINSLKFVDHFLGIAIGEYTDEMGKLRNPVDDVYAVRQVLFDFYDIKEENATVLDDENASKSNIIKTIESYKELGVNDRLLIYFSGHGEQDKEIDVAYWVPKDGKPKDKVTWISEGDFVNALKYLKKCKHILVISDSCFGAHFLLPDTKDFSRSAANMLEKPSRFGLASGDSYVSDGPAGQNSPFTKALVQILSANKGLLPVDELHIAMRKHLANIQSIHQDPHIGRIKGLSVDSFGQFVFIPSDHANITSKVAFEEAEDIDTLEAWDGFIRQHPTSLLYGQAIAHFNRLALVFLNQALDEEEIDLLEDFQKDYTFTPLHNKAKEYIQRIRFKQERNRAKMAYESARQFDTVEAYTYFLENFPHPGYTGEAKKRRRELKAKEAFEELLASKSVPRLETYLNTETDPKVQEQIKERIVKLQFQELLDNISIEKIDTFLVDFKKQLSPEQEAILTKRKKELSEKEVFDKIKRGYSKDLASYLQYFESHGAEGEFLERAKTDFFRFLESKLIYKIMRNENSSSSSEPTFWKNLDRLHHLDFWKAYQRRLNIPVEKYQNLYLISNDLQAKFDYFTAHFPNSSDKYRLQREIKEKLLEQSFSNAKFKNSHEGYMDFWRSELLVTADNKPKQKPLYKWLILLLLLPLLAGGVFYVYPKWQVDKAASLYFDGDYEEAYALLTPYEGSNDPKVIHFLNASRYAVLDTLVEPCTDLFKAGEQGFFRSLYVLGWMHLQGYAKCDIPIDTVKGITYLEWAAEQKEERALFRLAELYQKGSKNHLPRDRERAMAQFEESALLGHQEAQIYLGDYYWATGWSNDKEKALRWYRMAAMNGDAWSQLFVGHYWSKADKKNNHFDKAMYWYGLALQEGNPNALHAKGDLYLKYEMVDSAMAYYHLSACEGNIKTQFELANRYLDGEDLSEDFAQGFQWMEQCSQNGDSQASLILGKWYYDGRAEVKKDVAKSQYYFQLSRQQGAPKASFYLGQIQFEKLLEPNSIDSAIYYFTEAHEKDVREASEYLANHYYANEKGTFAPRLYNYLINKNYPLNNTSTNNLVTLLSEGHPDIDQKDAVDYLGRSVNAGNEKATKPFFRVQYQKLINERTLISSKIKTPVELSTEQIIYLENYTEGNDDEFLVLCGFFLEKDLEPKGTKLSFGISITDSLSLSYLDRAAKLGNPYAAYKLGEYYFKENQFSSSKSYYEQVVKKRDELPDVLLIETFLALGHISLDQTFDINSTFSEPIKYFREAQKLTIRDPRPYIALCRIYHQNGKSVQAKKYCVDAMEKGNKEAHRICIEQKWYIPPEEPSFWTKVKQDLFPEGK